MTGDHLRITGPMLSAGAVAPDSVRQALSIASGTRQQALSDAWWRTGIGRATGNQNARKHRFYTKAAVEVRRRFLAFIRRSQRQLKDIG